MKQNLKQQIESKLTTLEAEAAEQAVSHTTMKKNINEVKKFIKSSVKLAETMGESFSEEEQNSFLDRIESLNQGSYKIGYMSPRAKKLIVAASMVLAVGGVGTIAMVSMYGCGSSDEPEKLASTQTMEIETEEKIEYTSMSDEMKAFADTTVEAVNDSLEAGINLSVDGKELVETDKETYAKTLTQYRIVANLDDFTRIQYAELFGETLNPTEDLMNGYNLYNEMTWQHLLTVTENNNTLDYSNLYNNEKDAEVLNESYRLIVSINSAEKSADRLQAAKDWYSYVVGILTDTKGSNALSPQAMDTLIVHSEAYDELTRSYYSNTQGAHIDDELEHKFNVAKNICLAKDSEANIDVEDITISNLQSEFRIAFKNELESSYTSALTERELQLTLGNSLNQYNSFDENVSYVEGKIDLSKYREVEINHIEKQYEEKGINRPAEKSKDDSGVSNGNGGVISQEQFDQYGINSSSPTAKEELEQAVQEETKKQEDESTRVTDENNNTLQGTPEDNRNGFNAAYSAAMSGQPKPAYTGNQSYDAGIDSGWSLGIADKQAAESSVSNNVENEYVPVENGETTTTESEIKTETYTEQTTENLDSSETISDEDRFIEEETTFVPIAKRIEELNAFKDSLQKYIIPDVQENSKQFTV